MSPEAILALAEITAVILAGLAILVTLKGIRDQLWIATFSEYTRRYADVVKELPSESRKPGGDFHLDRVSEPERGRLENAIRAYLNLCSEEYYLYRRGKLDGDTWDIWRTGIQDTLRLPWFRDAWAEMRDEYSFYDEFCLFLDGCLEGDVLAGEDSQPSATPRPRTRVGHRAGESP